ncbi:MAG: TlpA family protein disulfide reductase [bacterium]
MNVKTTPLFCALSVNPYLGNSPKVGQKALDFTLKTFRGVEESLSDHKGKVILLDFWASWCAPCKEEMPYLDILEKTYSKKGFTVLAVNIDNHAQNALEFLKRYAIKLMPLWDEKKQVVTAYDVETMPTSLIIDKEGGIRFIHSGFKAEEFHKYKMEIEKLLKEGQNKSNEYKLNDLVTA